MHELELKLKEEAIKVYQETGLTPEKLLNMYKISKYIRSKSRNNEIYV